MFASSLISTTHIQSIDVNTSHARLDISRESFLLSTPFASFCPKQTILPYTPVCVMSLTASVDSACLSLWLAVVLYCREFYCGKAALNNKIPVTNAAYCAQWMVWNIHMFETSSHRLTIITREFCLLESSTFIWFPGTALLSIKLPPAKEPNLIKSNKHTHAYTHISSLVPQHYIYFTPEFVSYTNNNTNWFSCCSICECGAISVSKTRCVSPGPLIIKWLSTHEVFCSKRPVCGCGQISLSAVTRRS